MNRNRDQLQTPERGNLLLKYLGLANQRPGPDEWLRIGSYRIDGPDVTSAAAAALVQQLAEIAITADTKPYKNPDSNGTDSLYGGRDIADRIRIAVLVQRRDFEQARQFLLAQIQPSDDGLDPATRAELEYEKLHPEDSQSL